MKAGPDLYIRSASRFAWQVDVTNTGDAFLVAGTVEGVAATSCARCLADVSFPVTGEVEGYYPHRARNAAAPRGHGRRRVRRAAPTTTRSTSIAAGARPRCMLEFPLVPLCAEDCRGLCPTCGANLNEGACGCTSAAPGDGAPANPFAVLADYPFDGK